MKYITYWISGTYTLEVDDDTPLEVAGDMVCDVDFGELENIEWDSMNPLDVDFVKERSE